MLAVLQPATVNSVIMTRGDNLNISLPPVQRLRCIAQILGANVSPIKQIITHAERTKYEVHKYYDITAESRHYSHLLNYFHEATVIAGLAVLAT